MRRFSRVRNDAVVRAGEEDVGVLRIGRDVAGFAAARPSYGRLDAAAGRTAAAAEAVGARHAHRAVVLLRAADVIRHVLGRDDVVELLGREILRRPGALPPASTLNVTAPPPSLPRTTCFGSSGSIQRSW